ncbi:rho-gdp dissociation inhibitor [Protomyces lactucae-debilis]|uniref:Rho GDP-dissociation inhibitor n=1 Tax=Protomyces lactucae-debilis TaxID=2754530 RepID=A0A1Y2FQJ7_PROLT|nr:rho-gdp dissociation inhibitor [Protomyces lactucae-debilis]ORY85594.1 rho-gdp dissociation inhibitor [Protomyces lactucae-debilis]
MADQDDFAGTVSSQYKPQGPSKTIEEYAQLDANDESLNKWKASLGITSTTTPIILDPSTPAKVLIDSISLHVAGRPDITVPLKDAAAIKKLKETPFIVKEGVVYSLTIRFRVQRDVVSGLKYLQVVKRSGIKLDSVEEMLGSYGPAEQIYAKRLAEEEAPSGMLGRGRYDCRSRFVDDDGHVHLDFDWSVKIEKEWKDK